MKKIVITIICLLPVAAFAATAIMSSFSGGELTPRLFGRTDIKSYYSGCRELENMFVWAQGPVEKRPGTYYIPSAPGEVFIPEYPLLQELTDDEIPSAPSEPNDTSLSGASSITDKTELAAINGANHYYLSANIDCSGGAWTPITDFSGVIDGNNFTVSNISISSAASDDQGFIGNALSGCEIRNISFSNCSIEGDNSIGIVIGEISAQNGIKLSDIDIMDCNIVNDWGSGLGALIGLVTGYDINIFRCTATGTAIGPGDTAGGLIGYMAGTSGGDCNIVDCYTESSTVTVRGDYLGGLIGYLNGYSTTDIITVHECYSTMDIIRTYDSGSEIAGGLVGYSDDANYVTCYATGDIDITNDTEEALGMGGFIGFMYKGDITNCYSTGDVSTRGVTYLAGGFIGKFDVDTNIITRCYSTGDVTVTNYFDDATRTVGQIGGFVGGFLSSATESKQGMVRRCWSTGDVTIHNGQNMQSGIGGVGGFTGILQRYAPDIENCYAWGSVDFVTDVYPQNIGGFVGRLVIDNGFVLEEDPNITNCYVAQTDTAVGSNFTAQLYDETGETGGFLGVDSSITYDAKCVACFWDVDTSSVTDDASDGAVSHSTTWMQTKSNFVNADWDFDTIWTMPAPVEVLTVPVRLIDFVAASDQGRIIELGNKYMTFCKDMP